LPTAENAISLDHLSVRDSEKGNGCAISLHFGLLAIDGIQKCVEVLTG